MFSNICCREIKFPQNRCFGDRISHNFQVAGIEEEYTFTLFHVNTLKI